MAITTSKVLKPKINGVYQVKNTILGFGKPDGQHDVIVLSINKKRKKAKIKTITSLERRKNSKYYFKNGKLDWVRNGMVIVIPKTQLKSKYLSGIHHNSVIVPLSELYYKEENDKTRFPARYRKLIIRK